MSDIDISPVSKSSSPRIFWLVLFAGIIVIAAILLFFVRIDFLTAVRVMVAPEDKKDTEALGAFGVTSAPFVFLGTGTPAWFSLTHRGAVSVPAPQESDAIVLADGSSVYSEMVAPEEGDGEVIGILSETPRPQETSWRIVHNVNGEKTVLGEGRSPRLLSDDTVIVLSQEGLVTIQVTTGVRTILMSAVGASGVGGALSADGLIAVVPDGAESVSFFMLQEEGNAPVYQGVLPVPDGVQKDITFMSDTRIAVLGADTISVYEVPVPEQPFARTIVTFPIMK